MTKELPRRDLTGDELLAQMSRYTFTRFKFKGKWIYVKQISKEEYDEG